MSLEKNKALYWRYIQEIFNEGQRQNHPNAGRDHRPHC